MNIVLWIITGLLAVAFLASGGMKLLRPKEQLVTSGMAAVENFPAGGIKTIGALEVLAAIGLILPAATHIAPILVPVAAVGLVALMIGAAVTHLRRKENQPVLINVVLLILAAVVAWGRFGPYSF